MGIRIKGGLLLIHIEKFRDTHLYYWPLRARGPAKEIDASVVNRYMEEGHVIAYIHGAKSQVELRK